MKLLKTILAISTLSVCALCTAQAALFSPHLTNSPKVGVAIYREMITTPDQQPIQLDAAVIYTGENTQQCNKTVMVFSKRDFQPELDNGLTLITSEDLTSLSVFGKNKHCLKEAFFKKNKQGILKKIGTMGPIKLISKNNKYVRAVPNYEVLNIKGINQ